MPISEKSELKLKGVHLDLVRVVRRFTEIYQGKFEITCGMRTLAEQEKLLKRGATTTLKSRHLTGHAVDISPCDPETGKISYDWPLYYPMAKAMKQAAKDCGVALEWGGDWKRFKDGPHFQLPWKQYPIAGVKTPPQPAKEQEFLKSRTVIGTTLAATGGVASLGQAFLETSTQLSTANEQATSGQIFGYVIAIVIIAGALLGLYARITGHKGGL